MKRSLPFHVRTLTTLLSILVVVTQLGAPARPAEAAAPNNVAYVHDQAGRLVGVVDSTNVATYKYDPVGNLLSIGRYSAATVSIIQITPGSAASGTSVLIYGSAFSTTPSQNTVTFNGTASVVTASTATQIVTTVPAGATTGSVNVTTPVGSATSAAAFTVTASLVPTITGLNATIATPGTTITVSGTNFQGILTNNDTLFNTTHAIVTAEGLTSLTVTAPPSGGSGHVTVITPYGQATSAADFFIPPAPYTPASVGITSRMALGNSKTYTFGTASQIGLFLFDGTAGQRFSLNISFSLSGPDALANLWVYNPDGSILVPHTVGGCCLFVDSTLMPQTGTYMFVIDPGRDTGTATFSLYNVPPDNTGTITMGGPSVTLGNTVPGQDASLYFSGTAGQQISVTGSSTFSNNGSVTLMNPDGTTLLSSGPLACCLFFDRTTLPQTGTYRFFIDAGGPAVGNATLTLYNVPPDNTGTITVGGPSVTLGNTVPGQDASLYFSGTAGQKISVTGSSTFNNNGSVTLMNPDGTTLLSSGPLACCLFFDRTTLPQTGTYRFFIDAGGATIGNATLTLYLVPPDATGTITIAGPSVSISNTVPGQNMQLTFSGTTGKTINLNSSFSITSTGTCISIYNPDGTTLVPVQCPFGGNIGPVTLQQTGTFTILIDPYQANIETATETLTDPPTPTAPVQPGAATAHHSPPSPAAAEPRRGGPQLDAPDQSAGPDPNDLFAGPEDWPLDRTNFGGDWTMPRAAASTWRLFRALQAQPAVTALAGQVLKLNGAPLADVTLSFQGHSATSDMTGRFLITGIVGGTDVLRIDGSTADRPNRTYGIYEVRTDAAIGKTTVLPYTIWMTRLDQKNAVTIPSPTTKDTVVSTPLIPGLQVVLPAGSVVKDDGGNVVTQLSITPVPVNRPPFPLPAGVVVPLYFTVQPGSTYIFPKGARIIYPNYTHEKPGTRVNFWNYDPDQKGWYIYGQGSVTADGSQVVPDPGVVVWEFSGAMINVTGFIAAILGPILQGLGKAGDPVDLGTGLFVMRKTDLAVADIMPLILTRTYRTRDNVSRDFGIGTTNPYDLFLSSTNQYQLADLNLPDGGQIHYVRTSSGTGFTDAVFQTTTTASQYFKSTIAWNGNGWNLTLKDGTVYIFGANQPLQAIRDRHGNQITIIRAAGQAGNVMEILSPNGRWITFSYDASNRITKAQDNIGQTVTYAYDPAGHLWKVTDPNGGITTYTYDAASGGMQTLQDARNIVFLTNAYDGNGRVMKQTQNDQTTYQFSYVLNASNQVTEADVTDPRGIKRKATFNSDGYLVTDTSAVGAPEQQTITLARQAGTDLITSVTDTLNRQTAIGYDAMGNVTSVTRLAGTPNAVTTQLTYEPTFNQLSSVTDALSHQTLLAYDARGNLTTVTDPLQKQTTISYNYFGQPTSVKDPVGNLTQLQYSFGDPATSIDGLGQTTKYFIDGGGRPILTSDPLGDAVQTAYDVLNRPAQVTDANGSITSFTYDQNSHLTAVTDARTNTTSYAYDSMDRLTSRTDPLLHAESYAYDADGNVSQVTNRNGQVDVATYDNLNRATLVGFGKTVSNKGVVSYQSTISYTYDAGDRPTKVVDSIGGTITPVFDNLDRITSETTAQGQLTYAYDTASRRTSMQVAGQPAVSYSYDNANRLTSITQGTAVVSPAYDPAGRLTSLTLPNGVVMTDGYNASSQLTSITYAKGTTTLGDLQYSYDAAGHRIGESGAFARTNFPSALSTASYNADNQLTAWASTSLSSDANGNVTNDGTNTYTWDARNQLSSVATKRSASTFLYDAYGRRTQKTIGSTTTGYLYDGANPVQELSGSTPTANLLTGLAADQYLSRTDSGGTLYFLPDALIGLEQRL